LNGDNAADLPYSQRDRVNAEKSKRQQQQTSPEFINTACVSGNARREMEPRAPAVKMEENLDSTDFL